MKLCFDINRLRRIASNYEQCAQNLADHQQSIMQNSDILQGSQYSVRGFHNISTEWLQSTNRMIDEFRSIACKLHYLAEYYESLEVMRD